MKPIGEMTDLELREAVAVEAMGVHVRKQRGARSHLRDLVIPGGVNRTDYVQVEGRSELTVHELIGAVPAYESSIEAAFAVVDKMHPEYGFILERGPGDRSVWYVVCKRKGRAFYGPEFVDDSLPLAICRAALQAVRAK